MAFYRPATKTDVFILAPHLKEIDKKEINALTGETPEVGLLASLEISKECNAIIHDGTVVGIFGIASPAEGVGVPWLLCGNRIPEFSSEFMLGAKDWVKAQQDKYKILCNLVMKENMVAIKWLKRLGFIMVKEDNIGRKGETFVEFVRIRENV